MMQQKIATVLALTVFFCALLNPSLAESGNLEIDLEGTVSSVIDGDTYDMVANNGTHYRIRLADVDAPERETAGYDEAKEHLTMLVHGKYVHLDVDDIYALDAHGTGNRTVCVAYVEFNSTHYLNVNEALFKAGFVEKKDYDNEFNPYIWTLYVPKEESLEFPLEMILAGVAVVMLTLVVICLTRHRWHLAT